MFIKIHYFCTSPSVTVKLGGGNLLKYVVCLIGGE